MKKKSFIKKLMDKLDKRLEEKSNEKPCCCSEEKSKQKCCK
jgi:hypothetical protein